MLTVNLMIIGGLGVLTSLYLLRRRTRLVTARLKPSMGADTAETSQSSS